jgi:hypothetical protein
MYESFIVELIQKYIIMLYFRTSCKHFLHHLYFFIFFSTSEVSQNLHDIKIM